MKDTRRNTLSRAVHQALAGAMALSALFGTSVALAQQGTAESKPLEEIYVTGSRIARSSDLDSPSPVVSFNQDEINKSGYTNLQQLLEKQPFVGAGTFSTR